jgi:hypothetical protein
MALLSDILAASTVRGERGPTATVSVGTVTTGAAGSNAAVVNAGTTGEAILNFTIPTGAAGPTGPTGPTGPAQTNIPVSTNTTVVSGDKGKFLDVSAGVTINASTNFVAGDVVTIYNDSAANITITATAVTLRLAGTATTGNRTLAQRGIATLLCVASNEYVIAGAGLT